MRRKHYDNWADYERDNESTPQGQMRWRVPNGLKVVGVWLAVFMLLAWTVGTTGNETADAYVSAISFGIAGVVATLVWAWIARDGLGMAKAILFGGVITVAGFGLLMLAAETPQG